MIFDEGSNVDFQTAFEPSYTTFGVSELHGVTDAVNVKPADIPFYSRWHRYFTVCCGGKVDSNIRQETLLS